MFGAFAAPAGAVPGPMLLDATASSGLAFTHHAARSKSWFLPETMGSGGALLDLDGDGDLDVLLLDSGPLPGVPAPPVAASRRHGLFRNESSDGALRFAALHAPEALDGLAAMGACTGDVDRDGDTDVYVTGLPAGRLLLNDSGRLVGAPQGGGIADPGWGTSCVFFDRDRDGSLDLFVAHYVKWSAATERKCGGEREGFRGYCPPDQYEAEQDRLFAGDGKGRFRDVTEAAGLATGRGKSLGVIAADIDADGRTDLYVAKDQVASALWLAQPDGRFKDAGLVSGTALSEEGRSQAGMGVDAGDADGDLDIDLTKTNFALEQNNLYLRDSARPGTPRFRDDARVAGIARPSFPMLGFGTLLLDADLDGDLDIFVTNGHIQPNVTALHPELQAEQEDQLYENLGPRLPGGVPQFADAAKRWLPASAARGLGRCVLAGDLDDDGDPDLIVTHNDGPARVLRNMVTRRPWLGLSLVARASAPGAPGASVVLVGAGPPRLALRRTGGSYLGTGDERIVFGLGSVAAGAKLDAEVRWPSGKREVFALPAEAVGRYTPLVEGKGTPVAR